MLRMLRNRMRDDKGFTLIELMVVVLIIAILLAIAIPTFLRVRRNAQDRAAQSSLQAALKAEKAYYTEGNEVYTDDGTELESIEASVDYDAATNDSCALGDGPKCVEVSLNSDQEVVLIGESASGTFWSIRDLASGADPTLVGTFYGTGTTAADAETDAVNDNW